MDTQRATLIRLLMATLNERVIFIAKGKNCTLYQRTEPDTGKRKVGHYQVNFDRDLDDISYDVTFGKNCDGVESLASVNINK